MNCDYVAFEGIDGSGKSSIIEQLSKILDENKIENKIVREPGGIYNAIEDFLVPEPSLSTALEDS